jgi:hypothetical protein
MGEKSKLQQGLEELKEKGYDIHIRSYSGSGRDKWCLAISGDFDPIEVGFYLGQTEAMKGERFPYAVTGIGGDLVFWPEVEYEGS